MKRHEREICATARIPADPPGLDSGQNSAVARRTRGANVAPTRVMSFAAVVDRVRADFMEMPGLELTLPQAVRLWTIGMDDCRFVIDALVDVGFLKWTARRTVVRTGATLSMSMATADIPVRWTRRHDKTA